MQHPNDSNLPAGPLQPPTTAAMTGAEVFDEGGAALGLRVYGTEVIHRFPAGPWTELVVGSGTTARIPIADETVSRRHATIVRAGSDGSAFVLQDAGSKNGTYCEGARRGDGFVLRPGMWVAFGRVHLSVFNEATELVRARLQRFLGYGVQFARAVDDLHYAITHRQHIALVMPPTEEDKKEKEKRTRLVPSGEAPTLTRLIHEVVPGGAVPVVDEAVRRADDEVRQHEVYRLARGGTLVVAARCWPRNPATLRALLTERRPSARMVFSAPRGVDVDHLLGQELRNRTVVLTVPTMEERGALETRRAIDQAAAEYGRPLGLSSDLFTSKELDRTWGSPEELEAFVRRAVRLKLLPKLFDAAKLEGVSIAALSVWARRNLEDRRVGK